MARRRKRINNEEMYLISLDVFSLLSAMGVTIGIIFIILKPQFVFTDRDIALLLDPLDKTISTTSFQQTWNNINITFNNLLEFYNAYDRGEIEYNNLEFVRIKIDGERRIVIQMGKAKKNEKKFPPHLFAEVIEARSDSVNLKVSYFKEGGESYISDKLINSEMERCFQ